MKTSPSEVPQSFTYPESHRGHINLRASNSCIFNLISVLRPKPLLPRSFQKQRTLRRLPRAEKLAGKHVVGWAIDRLGGMR